VLIVTHGDAVNSSVTRLMPWTIVYPVLHTGFTVAYRDQHQGMLRHAGTDCTAFMQSYRHASILCMLVLHCKDSDVYTQRDKHASLCQSGEEWLTDSGCKQHQVLAVQR